MNGLTKFHELSVFLISFLSVVDGIKVDETSRMDAGQDPFEEVTLTDAGGVNSTLFGTCLAASRTVQATLYSIQIPGARNEYFRYVPDSSDLIVTPEWETVSSDPPVAKITDCAEAAQSGGYPMFKYSGGNDCKVSNRSYDLKYTPACEAEDQDAVSISNAANSPCPLPGILLVRNITRATFSCVTVNTNRMSYQDAKKYCRSRKAVMFGGEIELIGFPEIVAVLTDLKVESSNFTVDAALSSNGTWAWISPKTDVDPAYMVGAPSTSVEDITFMSGAADFKLDFAVLKTIMGGVVCLRADLYSLLSKD